MKKILLVTLILFLGLPLHADLTVGQRVAVKFLFRNNPISLKDFISFLDGYFPEPKSISLVINADTQETIIHCLIRANKEKHLEYLLTHDAVCQSERFTKQPIDLARELGREKMVSLLEQHLHSAISEEFTELVIAPRA
jgi:hypothetical protein